MRVVMIGPFGMAPKSTMSVRALGMARALAGRGHRVSLVVPPWDHPADSGRVWDEGPVRVYNLRLSPRPGYLALPFALARQTLALRPDLVHVFKPKAYSGLAATLLRWRGRRLVLDSDDWEGRGGWNQKAAYTRAQRWLFEWQEARLPRQIGLVTVASRTLETQMWARGLAPARVFYIPNGASRERYAGWEGSEARGQSVRLALGLGQRPVLLLYTRFVEFAVERVVQVLARVVRELPDARLLVVGRGLAGEEQSLLEAAGARGLAGNLVLAGWVEASALPDYLAVGDVAIHPYDDTLVNRAKCSAKLIDLMAAGRAIVADRVGQNAEYLSHHETGLLVEPGASTAMAEAAVRLLRDTGLRARLGEAARQAVWQRFDWQRLGLDLERAYAAAITLRERS